MARTSTPITAAGAIVREPLIAAPNQRSPRTSAVGWPGGQPTLGRVEVQLTVNLSDIIADLSGPELRGIASDRTHVVLAVGVTEDDGTLIGNGSDPAYLETTGLCRGALSAGSHQRLRSIVQRSLGIAEPA